jgi:phosphonate transport system substrate-binding protein
MQTRLMVDSWPSPTDELEPARAAGSLRLRAMMWGGLLASVGVVIIVAVCTAPDKRAMRERQARLCQTAADSQPKGLSPQYRDANDDMLADPPTAPAEWINPDVLVFACYDGDRSPAAAVDWKGLQAHMASFTARKIQRRPYSNTAHDVAAIASGDTHIVAVHGADVPYLVNRAGFVPVAVLADSSGAVGNHLAIAVRPDSPLHSLSDLRGRTLTCTRPDSITGCRAAVAALLLEEGLRGNADYMIEYSHGQRTSIRGLVIGDYEVVAISHEKLLALEARGSLAEEQYRLIHESSIIPRRVIGYVHNLDGDLAKRVREAIFSFVNRKSPEEAQAGSELRFVETNYKRDFVFERRMNDCFQPRFGQGPPEED